MQTPYLFIAGTPMAERHRAFAWETTPLGPPKGWDAALKTLVPVMLSSSQPMFVAWGPTRTLLYNDPYAVILGNKHPDALGRDLLEVWHEIRDELAPLVDSVYRGEPLQMDDIEFQLERSGQPEEAHFSFFYAPVRDQAGRIGGFFCACNETTAQIRAERQLAESEARHRGVLENMDEGFVLFDRDFTMLEVNPAAERLVGLGREAMVGRNHWERFPGSFDAPVGRLYRQALAEQRTLFLEHLYRLQDGRERWFEVRAFPVGDGLAAVFRDITTRRQMIEALQLADRRKDEFLAMLAHELRNPLAPIGSAARLLRLGAGEPARVRDAGELIERHVAHMARLVDELLDVSRVTRGLIEIERAPVDLQAVVTTAVEQARPLMHARGHALHTHADAAADCIVEGDFHRLVQVTANLLDNAAKYTPAGGRVDVRLGRMDGRAMLTVSDTGIGIAPEVREHVFELFAQAERRPDRSEGGLGIGLALVRSLVRLHGGEVHVDSAGTGQGSTFRVELPLAPARPEAESPVAPSQAPAGLRVLVVDDNVDAAATLVEVLQLLGHDASAANDAGSALAIAATRDAWDAAILDIGLPDMTGHELAQRLRSMAPMRGAVFIALTGYGPHHGRDRAQGSGFDHHLVKPADIGALADLLAGVAQRR